MAGRPFDSGMEQKQHLLTRLQAPLIVVSATIFLLLTAEILARGCFQLSGHGRRSYDFGHGGYGDLVPDQDGIWTIWSRRPYHVQTNSAGLRNIEQARMDTTLRILAVGDSMTFGPYVPNEDTWPARLEVVLRNRLGRSDIQVLNAGIAGYTIEDYVEYYRDKGRHLSPHLVILQFYPNDISDFQVGKRARLSRAVRSGATGWERITAGGPLGAVRRFLAYHNVALYEIAREVGRRIRLSFVSRREFFDGGGQRPGAVYPEHLDIVYSSFRSASDHPYYRQYEVGLREFSALVRESGSALVVVAFPEYFQIPYDGYPDTPQQFVRRVAESAKIAFLDLLPAFRSTGRIEDLYFVDFDARIDPDVRDPYFRDRPRYVGNGHLSRFGYGVAARVIADYLSDRGFLVSHPTSSR